MAWAVGCAGDVEGDLVGEAVDPVLTGFERLHEHVPRLAGVPAGVLVGGVVAAPHPAALRTTCSTSACPNAATFDYYGDAGSKNIKLKSVDYATNYPKDCGFCEYGATRVEREEVR